MNILFNVLEINLTTSEAVASIVDSGPWLGGRGMAAKLFTDRVDPGCEPLGPDNVVVFATSPLTGTAAPTAGRGHVVFKSPLTGAIGSANSGGRWAKILKSAGCDALVIHGAASAPVYISITDQGDTLAARVRILDASDLHGKSVPETTEVLTARHGGRACSVLANGPAGENRVRFASLMNENNRAYGRGGPGAVFGAKNLKAIVVNGSAKTPVVDAERFNDVIAQTRHIMKAAPTTKSVLRDLGSAGLIRLIDIMEMLPHRNFLDCAHVRESIRGISGEAIAERLLERAGACFGCPIMCQRHTRVGGKTGEGPEFETLVLMGPLLDIYDLDKITLGNYAANELGLDTMSLGGTLACAAELFESGALTDADAGGSVRFGDAGIYPHIVEKIAAREGFGDRLAEGSRRLAAECGRPETAMQVKGLELPAYDPRGMPAQALGYMTSPTGGCHLRGGYSIALAYFGGIKEVPRYSIRQAAVTAKNQQDLGIIQDSLGICRFTGYAAGAEHWTKAYAAATGASVGRDDIEEAAHRIATLERMFNIKAGFTRNDDDLPARFKDRPLIMEGRERVISEADRGRMLDDYYEIMGWDRDGVPLKETRERLGIDY